MKSLVFKKDGAGQGWWGFLGISIVMGVSAVRLISSCNFAATGISVLSFVAPGIGVLSAVGFAFVAGMMRQAWKGSTDSRTQ